MKDPEYLLNKLHQREESHSLRYLSTESGYIDFYSNDYLGLSRNPEVISRTNAILSEFPSLNGSTGSRLISGNHPIHIEAEKYIASFHGTESALLFNSGYDANLGFFSSVPSRHDTILYDEFIHASVHDGMRLSYAKTIPFKHNDPLDLEHKIKACSGTVWVITEAVFSMDGTVACLKDITEICSRYNALLVLDEAHSFGCFSKDELFDKQIAESVYARIITYGKAAGAHGAAVAGTSKLIQYLINFARSFIYTTALPPHSVATIIAAYEILQQADQDRRKLRSNFDMINKELRLDLTNFSPVISVVIRGNRETRRAAEFLKNRGLMVKAILSPTVPVGSERLRISLHSFNSPDDIHLLCKSMKEAGFQV
jgi:8-amino-7-oxononanoate synthase